MSSVFVIGHRNPDTDAICSAIGYADFARVTGRYPDAVAACCGDIHARTAFALEKAGIEPPLIMHDVRPSTGRICRREVVSAAMGEALADVYRRLQDHQLRSIPVLDDDKRLIGMAPLLRLLELLIPGEQDPEENRRVETSIGRIAHVLGGRFQHAVDETREDTLIQMVGAMSADAFTSRMHRYPAGQLMIVSGDRPTVQLPAIEYGVRCLVLTGNYELSAGLISLARDKKVSVIISPWDTATTTLLIRGAKRIDSAIRRDVIMFPETAAVSDIRRKVQQTSQSLFPVVDAERRVVGVFSKSDLVDPEPVRLVLVDHNEMGQAVHGADESKILEVIDHHRVGGGLMSREPMRFINEPVGSTCTLVTRFYREAGLSPAPAIGVCLAAGLISDTLNCTSPTTTGVDRDMLDWLSRTCKLDVEAFASDFFSAGSVLETYSPGDAVTMDCKAYEEDDWRFSISQIEENGLDRFGEHRDDLVRALNEHWRKGKYNFSCLLITDIIRHFSVLMIAGDARVSEHFGYPLRDDGAFELDDVVSRKKQLLPHILQVLRHIDREEAMM